MKREKVLKFEFVEYIPDVLEKDTVYISIQFATATHKCCCGCGKEVVTPLSPTDWTLSFDGASVSFSPSIGNWSFPCESHYWITRNRVCWSGKMTKEMISEGRDQNSRAKARIYGSDQTADFKDSGVGVESDDKPGNGFWQKLKSFFGR